MIDLFSGSGSATKPFAECGRHGPVIHVDISPPAEFRCRVPDQVPKFIVKSKPEFVWASPPCTEFSQLTALRVFNPGGKPRDPEFGMRLVRWSFTYAYLGKWWAVENVRGSEKYISPEFGSPWLRKDAWCVWSNLPANLESWSRWLKGRAARSKPTPSGLPRFRTPERSKIPRPLADAVHRAVCEAK